MAGEAKICYTFRMSDTQTQFLGLTTAEAVLRQKEFGKNLIPEHRKTTLQIFLGQFKSAIVILLLVAAAISFAVGDSQGAVIILLIILVNAVVGFLQEVRSEKKLYDVSKLVQPTATVKRDGVFTQILCADIVKGDLVQLIAGSIVPADMALVHAQGLAIDESSVSGESLPVDKAAGPDSIADMGTVVVRGMGEGIVTAIGKDALFGQIINLAETGRPTNFEKEIRKLSELCIGIIVLTASLLFLTKLLLNPSAALSINFIIFILAICIGILPETLPLIATVALSNGALKLSRLGVVVRNLSAIRDLGSITVLCSDKTGTLTENLLTVNGHFIHDEAAFTEILNIASGLKDQIADPYQKALAVQRGLTVKGAGIPPAISGHSFSHVKLLHARPFDAASRSAEFTVMFENREVTVMQGAYEVLCKNQGERDASRVSADAMDEWIRKRESDGQRILAFAVTENGVSTLAAVVSFTDPVRATAKKALAHAKNLGIRVKVISGDSELVTGAVARELDLLGAGERVITGFDWEQFSDDQKKSVAQASAVFARFLPIQKYELVRILGQQGEVVGYVGDGVNDAPSLRLADVGISVSNGTDIAKSASDIILLKRGLHVIVSGIEQGRAVFENVSKYLRATLTENLGNFLSISVLSLMIPYLPMLPVQILFTNLITDFPHFAIATDHVDHTATRRPRKLKFGNLIRFMIILSFVSSAADLTYFAFFRHLQVSEVQSGWFLFSTLAEVASLFSVRSRRFFFQDAAPSMFLSLISVVVVAAIFACVYVPAFAVPLKLTALSPTVAFGIAGLAVGYFLVFDCIKRGVYRVWPETY